MIDGFIKIHIDPHLLKSRKLNFNGSKSKHKGRYIESDGEESAEESLTPWHGKKLIEQNVNSMGTKNN